MKKQLHLLFALLLGNLAFSQETYLPDDIFEQKLINLGLDSGSLDDYVPTANIETLKSLDLEFSGVSSLEGIQDFKALESLICTDSNLTELDLSVNTNLKTLYLDYNNLTSLNLKNGNNINMSIGISGNSNLTCVTVDDAAWSTTNWTSKDMHTEFSENCPVAGKTYIPDDNFEQALIDLGHDDVLDDYVTTANIENLKILTPTVKGIKSFEGIADFVALESLNLKDAILESLDLSKNIALKSLSFYNTSLSGLSLDNPNLTVLTFRDGTTTSLDITKATALTHLYLIRSKIQNVDLSKNIALTNLSLEDAVLSSLNIENNLSLVDLSLKNTVLSSLNISNNVNITDLTVENGEFTSLDVSNNLKLSQLWLQNVALEGVDVSENPNLTAFILYQANNAKFLNLKNGANEKIEFLYLLENPNLNCVTVDNPAYSIGNWDNKDTHIEFSEDCTAVLSTENFTSLSADIYPNPSNGIVNINSLENAQLLVYNMAGQMVFEQKLNKGVNKLNTNLSKSVYFFKINSTNKTQTQRVIVK